MGCHLSCVECAAVGEKFERGWRGFLTDDEFEPTEVAILCPTCAERELRQQRDRTRGDEDDS